MADTGSPYNLPYPTSGVAADVPFWNQQLATATATQLAKQDAMHKMAQGGAIYGTFTSSKKLRAICGVRAVNTASSSVGTLSLSETVAGIKTLVCNSYGSTPFPYNIHVLSTGATASSVQVVVYNGTAGAGAVSLTLAYIAMVWDE